MVRTHIGRIALNLGDSHKKRIATCCNILLGRVRLSMGRKFVRILPTMGVILDDENTPPILWEVVTIFPDSYLLQPAGCPGSGFQLCLITDFWQLF